MKSYTFVFVILATIFLYTEYVNAKEICPQENCIVPENCEELHHGEQLCHQQGTSCCSIVKKEFKTHCRHHGGTCVKTCPSILEHKTIDCPSVCCVLV